VLLDPEVPEERRSAVVDQVKRQLDAGGAALKGDSDWGMRKLSFEIDHRREAEYHLFQFESSPELLTQLEHSLSIDDSVLRHRIIRLPGEAPDTPPTPPEEAPRRPAEDRDGPPRGRGRDSYRSGRDEGEQDDSSGTAEAVEAPAQAAPEAPARRCRRPLPSRLPSPLPRSRPRSRPPSRPPKSRAPEPPAGPHPGRTRVAQARFQKTSRRMRQGTRARRSEGSVPLLTL